MFWNSAYFHTEKFAGRIWLLDLYTTPLRSRVLIPSRLNDMDMHSAAVTWFCTVPVARLLTMATVTISDQGKADVEGKVAIITGIQKTSCQRNVC